MANGRDHRAATKRNLKWLAFPSLVAVAFDPLAIGLPLGLIMGHILTPDIDHHWTTIEELRMYSYSRFFGRLWSIFWWPYQKLHSHRGYSHKRFIGTAGRFLYLLWLPVLLTADLGWQIWTFWMFLYIGWCWQDFTHLRLDSKKYASKHKKQTRRSSSYHRASRHKNRRQYSLEQSYVLLRSSRFDPNHTAIDSGATRD